MVDVESKYYQVSAESADSQHVADAHRLKVKSFRRLIAFIGGSCVVLVYIAAISTYGSKFHRLSAAGSLNLAGSLPALRFPTSSALKRGIGNFKGALELPGTSPFKTIAISAILVTNLQRMQAQLAEREAVAALPEAAQQLLIMMKAREANGTVARLEDFTGNVQTYEKVAQLEHRAREKLHDELLNTDGDTASVLARVQSEAYDIAAGYNAHINEDAKELKSHEIAGLTGNVFHRPVQHVKVQDLAGVTAPLGFFDPLGFSTDASDGTLLFWREVEIKHGRVAMLAALGIVVGEEFHPFFGGDIDVPAYIAFQQTPLQTFWPAVLIALAIPELFSIASFEAPDGTHDTWWTIKADHQPGDLGFDPLGLKPKDPEQLKIMQTKELNNGRLAMIAVATMIAEELVTGKKIMQTLLQAR